MVCHHFLVGVEFRAKRREVLLLLDALLNVQCKGLRQLHVVKAHIPCDFLLGHCCEITAFPETLRDLFVFHLLVVKRIIEELGGIETAIAID
jgi:hypothetical protein